MGSRRKTAVAKQIMRARLMIDGTINNPDIQEAATLFGYPAARIQEGKALLDAVQAKRGSAESRRTVKKTATGTVQSATNVVYQLMTPLTGIARAVLVGDHIALGALGLDRGPLPRSRAGLLDAGRRFLNSLSTDSALATRLAVFGLSATKRSDLQAALTALEQAQSTQAGAKGAAEDATPAVQEALDALNAWVMQYRKLARIALKAHPQLLEKLGMPTK
ncbi:hypothetical protein [Armatimonas sp.]|uniref:hypothetical protein n=1 Tax=Armatimonas sp. TaxID=1872638 RepID=UPI0037535B6A